MKGSGEKTDVLYPSPPGEPTFNSNYTDVTRNKISTVLHDESTRDKMIGRSNKELYTSTSTKSDQLKDNPPNIKKTHAASKRRDYKNSTRRQLEWIS